jgi:hypothetical protein
MPASKAQRAATAERRGKAVAMKIAGLDFETIAKRLGYASRGAACTDIDRALAANIAEQNQQAAELRELEILRLDRLQAAAWTAAVGGDLRAIETVLKVIDRRARLNGLDGSVKVDMQVTETTQADLALQEMIREAEARLAADEAKIRGRDDD